MLTLNQERHLPEVFENVLPWAESVFVLDSLSTDCTIDIALGAGATVVQRPFTNFSDQWNWALDHFDITTPWTIKMDPDERVTPAFVEELAQLFRDGPKHDAYYLKRRLWFMGRPLNQKQWVLRLWRTGQARFSDVLVNEHPIVRAPTGRLTQPIDHLDTHCLHEWFEKQNLYSTMGAIEQARSMNFADRPCLFGTRLQRRMFYKRWFFRLPFRFTLLWLYLALYKRAIFCGRVGLTWARMRVSVRRWKELKRLEMVATGIIPEIPRAPHGDYDPRVVQSPAHIRAWQHEKPVAASQGRPAAEKASPQREPRGYQRGSPGLRIAAAGGTAADTHSAFA
jgi:glycosyltransferase involved in cell wall biosynthesis